MTAAISDGLKSRKKATAWLLPGKATGGPATGARLDPNEASP